MFKKSHNKNNNLKYISIFIFIGLLLFILRVFMNMIPFVAKQDAITITKIGRTIDTLIGTTGVLTTSRSFKERKYFGIVLGLLMMLFPILVLYVKVSI